MGYVCTAWTTCVAETLLQLMPGCIFSFHHLQVWLREAGGANLQGWCGSNTLAYQRLQLVRTHGQSSLGTGPSSFLTCSSMTCGAHADWQDIHEADKVQVRQIAMQTVATLMEKDRNQIWLAHSLIAYCREVCGFDVDGHLHCMLVGGCVLSQ